MMFKIFRIVADLWAAVFFGLAMLGCSLLFFQVANVPAPKAYIVQMTHLFAPALNQVKHFFGDHSSVFNGHHVHSDYGILIAIFLALFLLFMRLGALFNGMDETTHMTLKSLWHQWFVWKTKRASHLKAQAKMNVTETCALLGLVFENVGHYPKMDTALKDYLSKDLEAENVIFNQADRFLIRFNTTSAAVQFMMLFSAFFKQTLWQLHVGLDRQPAFHAAIHSLETANELYTEDSFVWALLGCAGKNITLLSPEAKDRFEVQARGLRQKWPVKVSLAGTFGQLGRRKQTDAYRLLFSDEDELLG